MPFTVNINGGASTFQRFGALWTPTVIVMSPKGEEEARMEGYLPPDEFRVWLEMALARTAFAGKRMEEAARQYEHIAREHSESAYAAEARYWQGVASYNATGEAEPLQETARDLQLKYPGSQWATRASIWLSEEEAAA